MTLTSTQAIYTVFFSLVQLIFIKHSFHHSSFYLYSILFITPASTQDSVVTPASIYTVFLYPFINPAYKHYTSLLQDRQTGETINIITPIFIFTDMFMYCIVLYCIQVFIQRRSTAVDKQTRFWFDQLQKRDKF